jgi:hypothetical protein
MANANVPRGLIPYCDVFGRKYNGSFNVYYVPSSYATALYVGDPVDIISGSNDALGTPAVQLASSGSPILGVMVGIVNGGDMGSMVAVTRDQAVYHPASTAQYIAVADDTSLLFAIQDDASTQARAPNLWAGRNANLVSGTGSTVTGYSGWQLQASSVATTNTLDLKIMRPLQQADNTIGTSANTNMNAKWLVKLNNLRTGAQIAGV